MIYLHIILFVLATILVIASIRKNNIFYAVIDSILVGINFTFVLLYLAGKLWNI